MHGRGAAHSVLDFGSYNDNRTPHAIAWLQWRLHKFLWCTSRGLRVACVFLIGSVTSDLYLAFCFC